MLKIDLILPPLSQLNKTQKISFFNYRRNSYWFPVWYYKNDLKKMGVEVRFLNSLNLNYDKLSKVVGISSGNPYLANNIDSVIGRLRKRVEYLLWFDHDDSTGKINYNILPFVDRYYKRQLLKNRSLYTEKHYDGRTFTDFYIRNYHLKEYHKDLFKDSLDPKYQHKLGLSWNFAYYPYRFTNKFYDFLHIFSNKMKLFFQKPSMNRNLLFSANFRVNYLTPSITFQRKQLFKVLSENFKLNSNVSFGYVSKKVYLNTIRRSKAVFSPFGYGEICCRDFEAFIAGAALIKPDMEHLETWPDLYIKDENYISLPWNVDEWDTSIDKILKNDLILLKIAKNGQNAYKKIWTKKGKEEFCNRFIKLITPN